MNPDLPTLNSKDLVIETPTPQEEIKQVDRPRYDVPIMIEITEEDRKNAGVYSSADNCLVCTALHRMGYKKIAMDSVSCWISKGRWTFAVYHYGEPVNIQTLFWDGETYGKEVVGKQIILYPANT